MIIINEWIPNPTGSDAENEWAEIFNGDSQAVNLSGWRLENQSGQKFSLHGNIPAHGYAVFRRPEMKLTLRNTDGKLLLYDPKGTLVHESAFYGTAPEGKSYAYSDGQFFFTDPTPGEANIFRPVTELHTADYLSGQPLHAPLSGLEVAGMALGVALIFASLTLYVIKKNNDLSKLLFGGYEKIR